MGNGSQSYNVEDMKPIESQGLDLSEYEGKKAKIEIVEVVDVESRYGDGETEVDGRVYKSNEKLPEGKTIPTKVLKVSTEKLGEIETSEGKKEIRASELFSLKKDTKNKSWGWSTHEKAKVQKLYKRLGIRNPNTNPKTALIGKTVTVIQRPGEDVSWLGILV